MYCSTCGKPVNDGLRFCSHCGAKLASTEKEEKELSEASFYTLIGCIMGLPIAGLGLILGMMVVMKEDFGFSNEVIIAFTAISFLLMAAAETTFIWMLVKRSKRSGVISNSDSPAVDVSNKQLREHQDRPDFFSTVTEHTTRDLEPARRETKIR